MGDIGQFMNDAFFDDPDFERMFENQVLMEEKLQHTDEVTSVPFLQVNENNCPFNKETWMRHLLKKLMTLLSKM